MAYTFVKAQGGAIGTSLVEDDMLDKARAILAKAEAAGTEFLLPHDTLCADNFAPDANTAVHPTGAIPGDWMGLDIGPDTRTRFVEAVLESRTILWNGPVGVFEFDQFGNGDVRARIAQANRREQSAQPATGHEHAQGCVCRDGIRHRFRG